jgi:hypothetical protein
MYGETLKSIAMFYMFWYKVFWGLRQNGVGHVGERVCSIQLFDFSFIHLNRSVLDPAFSLHPETKILEKPHRYGLTSVNYDLLPIR